MAALRNLVSKIPGAAALRSLRSPVPAPKSDIEKALLLKNNIESAKEADLRSAADLLAQHADQNVEATSPLVKKHEAVVRGCVPVSMKFFGSAVVLGCINRMLD